jgi:hypothetical protein
MSDEGHSIINYRTPLLSFQTKQESDKSFIEIEKLLFEFLIKQT